MDGPVVESLEHSDSDSGESWILLEDVPADVVLDSENPNHSGIIQNNLDKDEDTDGISIISDSEPESTPSEMVLETSTNDENRPTETQKHNNDSEYLIPNSDTNDYSEPINNEDIFLGDNSVKHKTYVHRRNKRLSTVLNIIVLGSIITAAGVAIGHMWGIRDDCVTQSTPSVNKILSNLYKLQEENAYLRNKLKELTLFNNIQTLQRKVELEKNPIKPMKCKKVFEEQLTNQNVNIITKCVHYEKHENKFDEPDFEKEFVNDLSLLKNFYKQNRCWLDEEIASRLKTEARNTKKLKDNLKSKSNNKKIAKVPELLATPNVTEQETTSQNKENMKNTKISYADSLKSGFNEDVNNRFKRDLDVVKNLDQFYKKKPKKENNNGFKYFESEEDVRKDDRYVKEKHKKERKKQDRQKINKKQKRRNKYEQWEMKGGYMNDYDAFSSTSSQDNAFDLKKPSVNFYSRDFERRKYDDKFSETDDKDKKSKDSDSIIKNDKIVGWFEKRAVLRNEARARLEKELFGHITPNNNAGWYFRRMQRREHCRAKDDNSTYRKLTKRNMNFKTKH